MNQITGRPSDLKLYLRLLRYVAPYTRVFLLSLLCMIVLAATAPLVAALLQPALDDAFIARDAEALQRIPIYIVLLFAVRAVASYVSIVSLHWVANKVVMDLRGAMFRRLLEFSSEYYDGHSSGSIVSKFTYDVTQIKQASTESITVLFRDSLYVAGLLGWMLYLNWQLTLVSIASGPFIVLIVNRIRTRLRTMNRRVQDSMGDIHHSLAEVIGGHRIVKLFAAQGQEAGRFHEIINASRRFSMKAASAAAASSPGVELVTAAALAVVVYVAGRQALAGGLSVGSFVSFFGAIAMMLPPLKRLVRINEHLQRGLAACESVFGLLDEPGEADAGRRPLGTARGEIELRGANFRYPSKEQPALQDVRLRIEPGETVALVGASGSGKTTLAGLIPRFYRVEPGQVYLDGRDVTDIPLADLRGAIALVTQDPILFDDTVRNNIAFGAARNAGEEAVIAAAEAANAMEFIRALPQGLDTRVGERGGLLSGGQRQRIALARALLKGAPVLILDEPTSALDAESERQIKLALEKVRRRHTCIVIAHRLSTIEYADRVIVLEHGRIVQTGTHKELLRDGGAYAQMHGG